ncbi:hypothetical protein SPI_06267 [Niveomyces insectorum RCEF 264]|uniref:Up-regulated during septation protein 1 domain-containing protein n=1 Tax=Niveomyces insectorum RCEF 264 TaxID=1081102 RepID=A0A167RYQ0_9HYPO|nr:hypothetical protein SPI_06267 [Niveomyces insectorum RCEF 264]
MDHIISCMLNAGPDDLDHQPSGYIETPVSSANDLQQPPPPTPVQDKPAGWRMPSPSGTKYQLFPKDKQAVPAAPAKASDPEHAMGQNNNNNNHPGDKTSDKPSDKSTDKSTDKSGERSPAPAGNGLRLRIKEHTLIRRRKVSVPELGPMTTVQEIAMDSPTIPGRPPLHERSISAPGNSWRLHHLVDYMIPQPAYDDIPEGKSVVVAASPSPPTTTASPLDVPRCSSAQAVLSPSAATSPASSSLPSSLSSSTPPPPPSGGQTIVRKASPAAAAAFRQPLSPKNLAPLVIPPLYSQGPAHFHAHAHTHSLSHAQAHPQRGPPTATTPHSSHSSRFRSGSTPVGTPFTPLSASMLLTTPKSAISAASTAPSAASTLPTPVSASSTTTTATASTTATVQPPAESRASPTPTRTAEAEAVATTPKTGKTSSGAADSRGTGNTATPTPATAVTPAPVETKEPRSAPPPASSSTAAATKPSTTTATRAMGHRRGQSESSSSIMERGRPRKRSGSRGAGNTASAAISSSVAAAIISEAAAVPQQTTQTAAAGTAAAATATATAAAAGPPATLKRSTSKASRSAERRAFELLPRGYKASRRRCSRRRASSLSRELRHLDERTEYLRRTYTSLRAGRRNLHARICQYLRSPRVAKFSHDSMLKQEEVLAELDTSIDDWVTKLEQAENRRTRVRQKLLEHVAAAATLPWGGGLGAGGGVGVLPFTWFGSSSSNTVVGVSESLQLAMGIIKPPSPPYAHGQGYGQQGHGQHGTSHGQASNTHASIATPPRSPTKASFAGSHTSTTKETAALVSPAAALSPSPQRPIVAQVPSTILEQPLAEEAMAALGRTGAAPAGAQTPGKTPATAATLGAAASPESASAAARRIDVESIRIYAGDDVYALLADVENQITQMGHAGASAGVSAGAAAAAGGPAPGSSATTAHATAPASAPAGGPASSAYDYFAIPPDAPLSAEERKQLHRAHSQELLNGGLAAGGAKKATASSPPASPTGVGANGGIVVSPATAAEMFLTNAVFRPKRGVTVN